MASRTLAFDLGGLRVWLDTDPTSNRNEVHIDEVPGRPADAIGVRLGTYARDPSDNGGRPSSIKFSIDQLLPGSESDVPPVGGVQGVGPRRSERMMAEFGPDDDPAAAPGAYRFDLFDQEAPVGSETDKDERRMLTVSKAKGLEAYLPINAYAGINRGAPGATTDIHQFFTDDGVYCFNFQGPASGQPLGIGIEYKTTDAAGVRLPSEQWVAVRKMKMVPINEPD